MRPRDQFAGWTRAVPRRATKLATALSPRQCSGESPVYLVDPLRRDRAAALVEILHEHPARQDRDAVTASDGRDQVGAAEHEQRYRAQPGDPLERLRLGVCL